VSEERSLSLPRKLLFAALVTIAVLFVLNQTVQWAEQRQLLDTHRSDDTVQFVEAPLFENEEGVYSTTRYAENSIAPVSFQAEKGEGWRLFVLGGSFAMGSPYIDLADSNGHAVATADEETGIPGWLQANLTKAHAPRLIEVVNAAAGGQNSGRVKDIASEVLELQPDALFVCSGNNEGTIAPSRVREQLQRLGGYRLLQKLVANQEPAKRPWFTPQDPDTQAIREQFQRNIKDIVQATEQAGVPLFLCTVPINLSYIGLEPGHVLSGRDWPHLSGPCYEGIALFDNGRYEEAIEPLEVCSRQPESTQPPPLRALMAMVELELGRIEEDTLATLEEVRGTCITQGIQSYYKKDWEHAIEQLEACDEVDEALLWLGLSQQKLGQHERAKELLRQHVELIPRNRTRPSLNSAIREIAAAHDHVYLVDLERAAGEASPDGIPGRNLFLDYCHMHWKGYAAMAAEVLAVLNNSGVGPKSSKPKAE
jgi:lysophospholipase L1-like esterase